MIHIKDSAQNYHSLVVKYYERLPETQRQRFVATLSIILTLFTVSFFGVFAINPTFTTITNLQKQLNDDKAVEGALKQKLTNLQQLDAAYQLLTPDLPSIYLAIPTTAKAPYLTGQLNKLAGINSVVLSAVEVSTFQIFPLPTQNSPLFSYTFTAVVKGDQSHINEFLSQLTQIDRMISIEDLATTKSENSAEESQSTIVGRAFFYPK